MLLVGFRIGNALFTKSATGYSIAYWTNQRQQKLDEQNSDKTRGIGLQNIELLIENKNNSPQKTGGKLKQERKNMMFNGLKSISLRIAIGLVFIIPMVMISNQAVSAEKDTLERILQEKKVKICWVSSPPQEMKDPKS